MAIKMRNNKDQDAVCCECGGTQEEVLNMFDLLVGGDVFTVCDVCNEKIFYKTLQANVIKDSRTKTQREIGIIRRRKHGDRF